MGKKQILFLDKGDANPSNGTEIFEVSLGEVLLILGKAVNFGTTGEPNGE
jgi:hypothetical protein